MSDNTTFFKLALSVLLILFVAQFLGFKLTSSSKLVEQFTDSEQFVGQPTESKETDQSFDSALTDENAVFEQLENTSNSTLSSQDNDPSVDPALNVLLQEIDTQEDESLGIQLNALNEKALAAPQTKSKRKWLSPGHINSILNEIQVSTRSKKGQKNTGILILNFIILLQNSSYNNEALFNVYSNYQGFMKWIHDCMLYAGMKGPYSGIVKVVHSIDPKRSLYVFDMFSKNLPTIRALIEGEGKGGSLPFTLDDINVSSKVKFSKERLCKLLADGIIDESTRGMSWCLLNVLINKSYEIKHDESNPKSRSSIVNRIATVIDTAKSGDRDCYDLFQRKCNIAFRNIDKK